MSLTTLRDTSSDLQDPGAVPKGSFGPWELVHWSASWPWRCWWYSCAALPTDSPPSHLSSRAMYEARRAGACVLINHMSKEAQRGYAVHVSTLSLSKRFYLLEIKPSGRGVSGEMNEDHSRKLRKRTWTYLCNGWWTGSKHRVSSSVPGEAMLVTTQDVLEGRALGKGQPGGPSEPAWLSSERALGLWWAVSGGHKRKENRKKKKGW